MDIVTVALEGFLQKVSKFEVDLTFDLKFHFQEAVI